MKTRARSVLAALAAASIGLVAVGFASTSASAASTDTQPIYIGSYSLNEGGYLPSGGDTWQSVALPNTPLNVVISPDGATLYYSSNDGRSVYFVDRASNTVTRTVALGANSPWVGAPASCLNLDGSRLYLAGENGYVTEIDTASGAILSSVKVGSLLRAALMTPDGTKLVISDHISSNILILDPTTLAIQATIPVADNPQALTMSPDGSTVVVGHDIPTQAASPVVTVISLATNAATGVIPSSALAGTLKGLNSVVYSASGDVVYGITTGAELIEVSSTTWAITSAVTMPFSGQGFGGILNHLAVSADGKRVYINYDTGVAVYDTVAHAVSNSWTAGQYNSDIALVPEQAPVAQFSAVPAMAGNATTFDAGASSIEFGTIASYHWDFGDGSTFDGSSPTTSHTYSAGGTYTVELTVTSSSGTSASSLFTGRMALRNGTGQATEQQDVVIDAATLTVTLDNPGPQTTVIGAAASLALSGQASDGAGVTYSATGLPEGLTLNSTTGVISGSPTVAGSFTSDVTACSVTQPTACASVSFVWTVTADSPPIPPDPTVLPTTDPTEATPLSSPDGGSLANTGASSTPFVVGFALLTIGAVAIMIQRRRQALR